MPDGPKVGTVSLSPRGDWRMPSDADPAEWLRWREHPMTCHHGRACCCMPRSLFPFSRQQFLAHVAVPLDADQPLVQALVGKAEVLGVEAQQVKDRGLEVVDGDGVLGDL